ncbi:MAG: hypothetical protein M5R41_07165 [Bacteroidia bacterium]|nr:hypothetical protein [Bacteroidia bacterium]
MRRALLVLLATLLPQLCALAQVPVEVFSGPDRTSVDVLFFRFFRTAEGENSDWLFFNRNRAILDHRMTTGTRLPQFGFTEAVSWNPSALGGFAPVAIGQLFSSGAQVKSGLQYARVAKRWTVFSWFVTEIQGRPDLDAYLLARWTPPLTERWSIYTQLELLNVFPTDGRSARAFTQRVRLGAQWREVAFGVGADYQQRGRGTLSGSGQTGVFVRYQF